jgi:hypothetical protein
MDPATTLGPIQNRRQYERVCELKDDARHRRHIVEGNPAPPAPAISSRPR